MTATEIAPAALDTTHAPESEPALYRILTTGDHKIIGRLYIVFSLLFLLVVLTMGVLVGFERVDQSGVNVLGAVDTYFQAWTLWKFGLIVLTIVPLFVGIAWRSCRCKSARRQSRSPGGRAVAVGVAGRRTHLLDLDRCRWRSGRGPRRCGRSRRGRAHDRRDDSRAGRPGVGGDLHRDDGDGAAAAGMYLHRVPLLAWSSLVASVLWLLLLPVAVANLVIAYVDFRNAEPVSFGNQVGLQISWMLRPPTVFAFVIPRARHPRRRLAGRGQDPPKAVRRAPRRHCAVRLAQLRCLRAARQHRRAVRLHRDVVRCCWCRWLNVARRDR
jgi:hypothetical protein